MVYHQYLIRTVNASQLGQRLDQALAKLFPDYSRTQIKSWILDGQVKMNGKVITVPKKKYWAEKILRYK